MLFQFTPLIQAGIEAGKYAQVFNSAGIPIGVARDTVTGQFVGNAIGVIGNSGAAINPLFAVPKLAMEGVQISQLRNIQNTLGYVQNTLGILQTTTAFIGVGVVANVAISGVNLWQTFKLREDVKKLNLAVNEGFIDLKNTLQAQGKEIVDRINLVAEDVEFREHRTILARGYGRFLEATKLIKIAMSCQDLSVRNADLANARQILTEAVADYNNPYLLSGICPAGYLRRLECAWAIEQTITLTYQLQNEYIAVNKRLTDLQKKIRQDCLKVVDRCEKNDDLDFIFPEITCIADRDLIILKCWQNRVNWVQSLSLKERNTLLTINPVNDTNNSRNTVTKPAEITLYKESQQKSHFQALRDRLKLMMSASLRQEYQNYISDRAAISGHKTLANTNLKIASDLTIANLYWYFKSRYEA